MQNPENFVKKSLLYQLAMQTNFDLSGTLLTSNKHFRPLNDISNVRGTRKINSQSLTFTFFVNFTKNHFIAVSESNILFLFYYDTFNLHIISTIKFPSLETIQYISNQPIRIKLTQSSTSHPSSTLNLLIITNKTPSNFTSFLKLYTLSFPSHNFSKHQITPCFNGNKFQHPYTIEVFKDPGLILISNGSSVFNLYNIKTLHLLNLTKRNNRISSDILSFRRDNVIEVKVHNDLLVFVLLFNNQINITIEIEVYKLPNFNCTERVNIQNVKLKNKVKIRFNTEQPLFLDYFETVDSFLLLKFYNKSLIVYNINSGSFITGEHISKFNTTLNYKALIIIDAHATLVGIYEDRINVLQLNTEFIETIKNIKTKIEGNKMSVFNNINKETKEKLNLVILICMEERIDMSTNNIENKECYKYLLVRKESVIIDRLKFEVNEKEIGKEIKYMDVKKGKMFLFMRNGDILEACRKRK